MRRYLVAAALVALVLPVVADGEGAGGSLDLRPGTRPRTDASPGDGEGPGTALGNLAMASGFFAQTFGQTPGSDPAVASGRQSLGLRYRVVYTVPGAERCRQPRRPASCTRTRSPARSRTCEPGQPFWDGERTTAGGSARL